MKKTTIIVFVIFLSALLISCMKTNPSTEILSHDPVNLVDVEINGEALSIKYLNQEDGAKKFLGAPNHYTESVKRLKEQSLVEYTSSFGKIPDEQSAVKAALIVFAEIYGIDCIKDEQPFQVVLNKKANAWIVLGSLLPNTVGGVAITAIERDTGEVLMIYHGL